MVKLLARVAAVLVCLSLAAGVVPVSAQVPKAPPAGRMYGYLFIDEALASYQTEIYAYVGGTLCGRTDFDPGQYNGRYFVDLDSGLSDCSQAGADVLFIVGACTADQAGTVPAFSGAQRLDMNAPGTC